MTPSQILKEEFENAFERLAPWYDQFRAEYDALDGNTGSFWSNEEVKKIRDTFLTSLTKRIIESEIEFARSKLHKDCFDGEAILTGRAKGYNQALKYIISHLESELKLINEN